MSTSAPGEQAVKEFVDMSIADRTVQTSWEGPLASGEGTLSEGSSAALDGLQDQSGGAGGGGTFVVFRDGVGIEVG